MNELNPEIVTFTIYQIIDGSPAPDADDIVITINKPNGMSIEEINNFIDYWKNYYGSEHTMVDVEY